MTQRRRGRILATAAATAGLLSAALVTGALGVSVESPRSEPATSTPFTIVLGTAQDGGLPQIGGRAPEDEAARRDANRRRLVASLLIVDPVSHERFLIDATPDLPAQVDLADRAAPRVASANRPPLFDAIALTHAHVGHYAGLLHLGREAYGAERQRVLASDRFARFLETNGPWDLLVKARHIAIERLSPDTRFALNARISLIPVHVPHRDEYSDTFGFIVAGPSRRILWLPDIDKWEKWDRKIEDLIGSVDVAYIDGTFFDGDELQGRAMSDVPHPFIVESLARFAALPSKERARIVFVHLNHTNAAATPGSKELRAIRLAGMRVAVEGAREEL